MVRENIDIKMAMFISENMRMIRKMIKIASSNFSQDHTTKEPSKMVSTMVRGS
jgi:hypothetical protein